MNNRISITENSVIKQYRDRISFENERRIYRILPAEGLIPVLREVRENTLILQRVEGPTFSAWLDAGASAAEAADLLAEWILRFGKAVFHALGVYLVLDDLNPRNLIVTPDGIRGLDFEQYHTGTKEEAHAVPCAMLRTMHGGEEAAEILEQKLFGTDIPEEKIKEQVERIRQRREAMPVIRRSSCTILAGGKASRMNGAAKGLLMLDDHTFMDLILHTVQIFDRICISANTDDYNDYGYPVIPDAVKDCGPAGALYTALMESDAAHVFTVPCDTPLLKRETIVHMYRMLEDNDAVVLRTKDRIHPTIGIYRKRILPVLEGMIQAKDYRMRSLLGQIRTVYCDVNEAETMNINTPEDLENMKKHAL